VALTGRPVLVLEACRTAGVDSPQALADHASALEVAGAHAVVVR
jgi:CHAT domain-containing protein